MVTRSPSWERTSAAGLLLVVAFSPKCCSYVKLNIMAIMWSE